MAVRHAIVTLLRSDAQLLELLADGQYGIHHRTAPQDAEFPFVTLNQQAGTPEYTFGDFHDDELWAIKGVDRNPSADYAEAIDERIRAVLTDSELPLIGQATLWFRRESDLNYGEIEEGAVIHHVGATYRILRQAV